MFSTPHGADLAALCAGYGVRHRLVTDTAALRAELAHAPHGVEVVEVRVDRAGRRAEGASLAVDVGAAVARSLPRGREGQDAAGRDA